MGSEIPTESYIPPKEAAMMLGLTSETVCKKADRGEIEHIRDSNGVRRLLWSSVMKLVQVKQKAENDGAKLRARKLEKLRKRMLAGKITPERERVLARRIKEKYKN